ncbi:hypothetical protein HDF10_002566 [Edaphobacter lichenicola]|uniref:Uncharacterized protein n=1 Tax=Tunturiibacter lichenicola TaxID=2051959 RepID=A0A7W8J8G9_9BACT|nr:hypothetical protein [Edaphobacter lichenicola]
MRGKRGEKAVFRTARKNTPRVSTLFLIGFPRMVPAGKLSCTFVLTTAIWRSVEEDLKLLVSLGFVREEPTVGGLNDKEKGWRP